jgi:hypothetical protein
LLHFTEIIQKKDRDFALERESWTEALFGELHRGNNSTAAKNSQYYKAARENFEKFKD